MRVTKDVSHLTSLVKSYRLKVVYGMVDKLDTGWQLGSGRHTELRKTILIVWFFLDNVSILDVEHIYFFGLLRLT